MDHPDHAGALPERAHLLIEAVRPRKALPLFVKLFDWGVVASVFWLLGVVIIGAAAMPHPLEYMLGALLLSSGCGALIYRWWLEAEERE